MLISFAGLAFLPAILGIYGVMSYGVAQRTHEIAVRMALGAQPGRGVEMFLSRGFLLTAVGRVAGLAGSLALGRYLETLLFEIKPADPLTLVVVAALLLGIALLAALLPAGRATRLDPMVILRYE